MRENKVSGPRSLTNIALIVLTTLLGMQLIRSLIPYFTFLLRERFELSTPVAGLLAILIFLAAFLANPLIKILGAVPAFMITTVAVGFTRLALQFWRFDPVGDFILAATGVIAFLLFLPIALGLARRIEDGSCLNFGIGLLVGIAADLALNGAFLSYDLSWQFGWLPALVVVLLVVGQFVLIGRLLSEDLPFDTADALFNIAITWIFFGPYLFLQLLIFTNVAWAATSTGLSFTGAFMLLLVAQILGFATIFLPPHVFRLVILISAGLALLLEISRLLAGPQVTWLAIIYLLFGQIALSGLLLAITHGLERGRRLNGLRYISISNGLGMLLLVIFLFAYYAVYDIPLPYSNSIIPLIALLIILMAGLPVLREHEQTESVDRTVTNRVLIVMILLLIIPVFQLITWQKPEEANLSGGPVRIVNYNLHNGVDPKGHLGLEALARVIEAENPDVVGLQEVSRGWVVNGSVDMLAWLSQRLGMTALYGPTADGQWGNAILTRLPVLDYENRPLPPDDLLLRRGYMVSHMDRGAGKNIQFINTHYHHKDGDSYIRLDQSLAILGFWNEQPNTIIVGDLNAEHGEPEIDIFAQAEFGDVLDITGVFPGYTNPVPDPYRRIDYIWITPDLQPTDAIVPPDEASDHLAVSVTLD